VTDQGTPAVVRRAMRVGPVLAAVAVAKIGDIGRFDRPE
jgi:hypothetical protein